MRIATFWVDMYLSVYRTVNSVEQDQLRVDVWDFNPEENVSEKEIKATERINIRLNKRSAKLEDN